MRAVAVALLALAACSHAPPEARLVDSRQCAGCHAAIAKTFRQTGMGRSFARATSATLSLEDWTRARFRHQKSERDYEFLHRGDRLFLRRSFGGSEAVLEREVHYVMGSGNSARTYIHRTPENRLVELPVGWYPEGGGKFAMSPGYDRPDHQDFRRRISNDCMFCHNAYPATTAAGNDRVDSGPTFPTELPEGIDCQRCHGPGSAHIDAARLRDSAATRASIVNPARLPIDRQMEVCMQCHLETTSFPLPNSLIRYERSTYSYRAGEPLADFVSHFDHAPGSPRDDKFEIVNSVYRLRKATCFIKSAGRLQCTTCHNPHDVPRGAAAARHYANACQKCHAQLSGGHPKADECGSCHMPKRRTEDVIHAVMTDHRIARPNRTKEPNAERHEPAGTYQGEVVPYYPAVGDELYLAVAQVAEQSNLRGGIPRLEAAIKKFRPLRPEFHFALGYAYFLVGRRDDAISAYRSAIERDPTFVPALRNLGVLLREAGRTTESIAALEKAGRDAVSLHELGVSYRAASRAQEAIKAVREAVQRDPDFAEAHNTLGGLLFESGDRTAAESAVAEAIRHKPDYAEAHHAYATLLASREDYARARSHAETATRLRPKHADAWTLLGDLAAGAGNWPLSMSHYRQALGVNPESPRANLGLGSALAATGRALEARPHLLKAAASSDALVSREATELLRP